ncbi:MAG: metallophosphoesterase [Acidobacteria bacterium]|nr:metallophosphoesterase [Acidobacteriota bacterium]
MAPWVTTLIDLAIAGAVVYAQWRLGRAFFEWVTLRRRMWLRWLPVPLASLMVIAFLLNYFPPVSQLPGLWFRSWMVLRILTALWAFGSTAVYLGWLAFERFSRQVAQFDPARRRLLHAAGSAAAAAPFAMLGYGSLIGRTDFRVRELDVPIPKLPPDLQGVRLLQLSDIHLSPFLSEAELARVVDAANHVRAQAALVTGDLITTKGDPLDACLRQLSRLRVDSEILGCLGNHEIYANAEEYATQRGARLGIGFLRQRNRELRFGHARLNIAGVDYQRISMRSRYLEGAEKLAVPGAVNVLLSHSPDVFPVAAAKGFDLTVSGHTHGGQVTIEILHQTLNVARFLTPYVYGLYGSDTGAAAYVSRGLGTVGLPARIGAPPEIVVLRLVKA